MRGLIGRDADMPGSWPQDDFPNLSDSDYIETSPKTRKYNCIAWAAGDSVRWWWPDPQGIGYWPRSIPRETTVEAFIRTYGTLGYAPCADGSYEPGFQKVALFAEKKEDGELTPTHAAVQLQNGHWSSKLGPFEDIEHFTLEVLNGPCYGDVVGYLKRKV